MIAWTYSSGDAAPKKIAYEDGDVVEYHCYTVFGWALRGGTKYIVLRNPWGSTETTVGVLSGTHTVYDISWWRPIALAPNDGTFGSMPMCSRGTSRASASPPDPGSPVEGQRSPSGWALDRCNDICPGEPARPHGTELMSEH